MREYIRRYKRYAMFLFNYIFLERLRGLDFTMRDTHLLKDTGGVLHGYSITPKRHLTEIFQRLSVRSTDKFIDIGCGKGLPICCASRCGFGEILGIDIDERLIRTANSNIGRLKLKNVRALCADATKFDSYHEYNYFFFCNPFSLEIFAPVFDAILSSMPPEREGKITVIYYHPTCADYIDSTGRFTLRHKIYDAIKDYWTYIYEGK